MGDAEGTARTGAVGTQPPRIGIGPWAAFSVIMVTTIWGAVVLGLPNAALTAIDHDLSLSPAGGDLAWTLMFAALAAFIVPAGQLADRIGRARVVLGGTVALGVLCLVTPLVQTGGAFLLVRLVQGVAAAMVFGPAAGIVNTLFTDPKGRARAFAVFGLVFGIGLGVGPVYGALIDDWQRSFIVTGVLVLGTAIAMWLTAAMDPGRPEQQIDVVGAVLLVIGLSLVIVGIDLGATWGWVTTNTAPTFFGWEWPFDVSVVAVMLMLGAICFALLVVVERSLMTRSDGGASAGSEADPLIDVGYFRITSYRSGVLVASLLFFGSLPLFQVFPQISQVILGQSPLAMTVTVAPMGVGIAIGGLLTLPLGRGFGTKWTVVVGMALATVTTLATIPILSPQLAPLGLAALLVPIGLGVGIAYTRATQLTLDRVEPARSAHAAGLMFSARSTLGAIGSVALTTIIIAVVVHAGPTLDDAITEVQRLEASALGSDVATANPFATHAGIAGGEIAEIVEANPLVAAQIPDYVAGFRWALVMAAAAFAIGAGVAATVRVDDGP